MLCANRKGNKIPDDTAALDKKLGPRYNSVAALEYNLVEKVIN